MFQGPSEISLDSKGRLAIPTRYRDSLRAQSDGHLVLTAHPHRCLLLYPKPAWEPIRNAIMKTSGLDRQTTLLQGLLVGHADDVEMDTAGRVLVSPALRRFAHIERDVMMFGQGSHFKLWNPPAWEEQFSEIERLGADLVPPGMESLSF
ncbi:MAG: division/cell wall cluster transcriptional repressor MraZ [Ferrovum sp.]|nr:division/cell wall cluster transcriptional repressor MraZ [Ferrovum sp.]NDU86983.1 division/cell wall cluster transcriptional repressor MraZ [Ferrovum sp.]